jgi:hypothetical protein
LKCDLQGTQTLEHSYGIRHTAEVTVLCPQHGARASPTAPSYFESGLFQVIVCIGMKHMEIRSEKDFNHGTFLIMTAVPLLLI